MGEVPVFGWRYPQVVAQFTVDVRQASGNRSNIAFNRKRQPDCVTWGRIRVLSDYDDARRIQRLLKRSQDAIVTGEVVDARRGFSDEALADKRNQVFVGRERLSPRRVHPRSKGRRHD